jgi:SAM-dependent methyltransferase
MSYDINLKKYENKIIKKLSKANDRKPFYNNWKVIQRYEGGYHSFDIYNLNIQGHRNNKLRINEFRKYINFNNKIVVDFGCSVGGILLHINELNNGIGFDFDKLSIKNANYILKQIRKENTELADKYKFINLDLNLIEHNELDKFINKDVDIIFLLSLGSWIKNWENLYSYSIKKGKIIVLETNNKEEGKKQIEFFEKNNCKLQKIINSSTDDNTGNNKRQTFIVNT